jgi:methionyl-tRNA formyltransferase
LKVVFLGTSEFAVSVQCRLAGSAHRPVLVVTPPDRRRGRGRRLAPPPAAVAARELGLELLQTDSVNRPEAFEPILAAAPALGVVCAFGQLIKDPLLSELPMLNVHPSLLPRWRGAAPIERAIMAGDGETGVTIMRVGSGFDSGPIALQESVAIGPDDDCTTLSARLAEVGGALVVRALDLQASGELEFSEQDDSIATYAEKISPSERRLDTGRSATELERRVRGLNQHIGTYLELNGGGRLAVRKAHAEEGNLDPGRIEAERGVLRVGCAEGVLRICVVQPQGRRPMTADAYLRGHPAPQLAV